MNRIVLLIFVGLVVVFGGGSVHPFGPVKIESRAPLFEGASIDSTSLERFQRACANCHSEDVRWPWYSYVAPASWMLERDVSTARSRMNVSRWKHYSLQEQITFLSAIGAALRTGAMPPQRYTILHPESKLPEAERDALYEWTKTERRRLRALAPTN